MLIMNYSPFENFTIAKIKGAVAVTPCPVKYNYFVSVLLPIPSSASSQFDVTPMVLNAEYAT